MNIDSIKGKKAVVIGLGVTGAAAAGFLARLGARVAVCDKKTEKELAGFLGCVDRNRVECFFGEDYEEALSGAHLVVVSPGVPPGAAPVREAFSRKIRVISEIDLFYLFCRSEIIAVTGTNGKTTTAFLVSRLLNRAGHKTIAAGNTGAPLTGLEPRYCDGRSPVVSEISSFQLEYSSFFRPSVSVVLNLTADHLDRHRSFSEYASVKRRIVERQLEKDFAVLNADDKTVRGFADCTRARIIWISKREARFPGVCVSGSRITGELDGRSLDFPLSDTGANNAYNCLAAAAVGLVFGFELDVIRDAIMQFRGLEHRREFFAEINGVRFVNDSKATNPGAVLDALESSDGPVVLICGGRDKGLDPAVLKDAARGRVVRVIAIGESGKKMKECFRDIAPCVEIESFHEAVRSAYRHAPPGSTVLLSPGCASFDMFSDFEERGAVFKAEVSNIKKELELSKLFL